MRVPNPKILLLAVLAAALAFSGTQQDRLVVGSKNFNEGYLLSEMLAQLLEAKGFPVERKFGLGGTLVCFQALRNGEIDVYPEYSGTIAQAILKSDSAMTYPQIDSALASQHDLRLLPTFGFNNTYALAAKRELVRSKGLATISDLQGCTECRLGFSLEFLNRPDGWPGLSERYGLPQSPRGMEHGLAYLALDQGEIDITDAYSTDGDIPRHDLALLEDDLGFFPTYLAGPLVSKSLPAAATDALRALAGKIDETKMQSLNAEVVVEGKDFGEVASGFLASMGLVDANRAQSEGFWQLLWRRTVRHIFLTLVSLAAAVLIAVPLGVWIYRVERIGKPVLYVAGLMQTIPSIALLALMIPVFGIGVLPAVIALFLYALLPILRNTAIALFNVDPLLKKVSVGIGMTPWQRLRHVEMPLAAPTILAGVRTAAVITIGTATLAAFIGAEGLGEPIVTGLALNSPALIMQGAIPAALLAVLVELVFEWVEKMFIPEHLRQTLSG